MFADHFGKVMFGLRDYEDLLEATYGPVPYD